MTNDKHQYTNYQDLITTWQYIKTFRYGKMCTIHLCVWKDACIILWGRKLKQKQFFFWNKIRFSIFPSLSLMILFVPFNFKPVYSFFFNVVFIFRSFSLGTAEIVHLVMKIWCCISHVLDSCFGSFVQLSVSCVFYRWQSHFAICLCP